MHPRPWVPSLMLSVILLFEDYPLELGPQRLHGGFEELKGERLRIQVVLVVDVTSPAAKPLCANHLWDFQYEGISLAHVLSIPLQGLEALRGASVLFDQRSVKCIVDFQQGEVLEVLFDAINGQDFFGEGPPAHHVGPTGDAEAVPVPGIDLPDPPCITIARCAHLDLGVEIPKIILIYVHLSVYESRACPGPDPKFASATLSASC
jgi:hypothetical protein